MNNFPSFDYLLELNLREKWIKSDTGKQWLLKSKKLTEFVYSDFWNKLILDFIKDLDTNQGWTYSSELDQSLNTKIGSKWLVTIRGQRWLLSDDGKQWLLSTKNPYIFNPNFIDLFNKGFFIEFAISEAGQKLILEIVERMDPSQSWIYSSELDQLLSTSAGQSWRNSKEGLDWLESEIGSKWLCNIHSNIIATNTYNWLNTGEASE